MLKAFKIVTFVLIITVSGLLIKQNSISNIYFIIAELFNSNARNLNYSASWRADNLFNQTGESASAVTMKSKVLLSEGVDKFLLKPTKRTVTLSPREILRKGDGIIFLETTNSLRPSSLVLCAIESAAHVYHNRPVVFFMKGLTDITTMEEESQIRNTFPTLATYKNVYIFPLRLEEIFEDTPLLPWYKKINVTMEPHWIHVLSDACRLALIWKHGGVYMDTDFISVSPIPDVNFVAAQSSTESSNGVFGFQLQHYFPWNSMENFVENYNGAVWGHQGPQLFTRVLERQCDLPTFRALEDLMCGNISFLNPQHFYPIPYPSWKQYYQVWEKLPNFNNSYSLHLWNYMNKENKTVVPGTNTLATHLYQQHCPYTYDELRKNQANHTRKSTPLRN
uniref:Alpha 1,4-glycosyltransferase domain-containing protein n=2 Tax=Xenopus tropicalis TaxID=8364 RepID=A0A803JFJ8_XENTR